MSIRLSRNEYGEQYVVDIWKNRKRIFSTKYSLSKYPKDIAYKLAEYSSNNLERMNNLYIFEKDYIIMKSYCKGRNELLDVLIDYSVYEDIKDIYWSHVYTDKYKKPYVNGKIKGNKEVRMHRYILRNELESINNYMVVDHINSDTLDNRLSNLRIVTNAENMTNQKIPRVTNTSGIVGVHFYNNSWHATWRENKKSKGKSFSVSKYGYEKAKNLAIQTRKEMCIKSGYLD